MTNCYRRSAAATLLSFLFLGLAPQALCRRRSAAGTAGVTLLAIVITLLSSLCFAPPISAGETDTVDETPIDDFDRDHWSFQPIVTPMVPDVHRQDWPRTSIDHFILARLEAQSLEPAAMANRETLIRRLSFDLTGLPPSTDQIDSFLKDSRPGAYRRLVDRMLASPQYGRRWGQYWLDLARFAETDGYEHDKIRPTAWQYRDWVIQAFNDDLPYDEFVTLQLAGDVARPDDPSALIATAFCLSGPDMPDINSQEERKHVLMNEVTSTVGAVFFSLQMGCAQCHDHKYDAISQADFYRLRAFFDPAVKLQRDKSVTTLDRDADPKLVSHLSDRGDWRRPGASVSAAFPRIANPADTQVDASDPGQRRLQLARWLTDPSHPLTARTIVNRIWLHHFGRGLSSTPSDFGVMGQEPSHSELLDHLASRLIARQWSLKDLHRQIVLSSVYRTRSMPDNDADENWNKVVEADPENRLLARFPRRRLDAESIRDAMLAVSGSLSHEAGGPGVSPPLPIEMVKTLKSGQWKTSPREADHYRRSIYIFARRNLLYPLFATFDRPAANCSCAIRQPSTTPVQSLLLLNSKLTLDAAQRLATVIASEGDDRESQNPESQNLEYQNLESQCIKIYRTVFSRDPDASELAECIAFQRGQRGLLTEQGQTDPEIAALTDLCRAMFNSNQFLYVD